MKGDGEMGERYYKKISGAGACSITIGIIMIATGLILGVLSVINGAKLLASRKDITF